MSTKHSPELVLFVGPPFTGKTLFYREHLADSHTRIVPSERFERSVSIGLPHIIREVIQHLKKGKSVVIDDLNWVKAHRNNYWRKVKEKVPGCSLRCLVFQPVFGIEQCLWSWQWWCAEHFGDHTKNEQLFQTQLNVWFCRRGPRQSDVAAPELPSANEPCTVENVKAKLICSSTHEWTVPALFLQWDSLLLPGSALRKPQTCHGVIEACQLWARNHAGGRIIVIADSCHGAKTGEFQEKLQAILKDVVLKIDSHPVYYLLVEEGVASGDFLPPKPGLLAWLQKAHMLSLLHKDTLYICSSPDHRLSASAAGVYTRMASELARSPSLVSAVNWSHLKRPDMLEQLKLVDCGSLTPAFAKPALPLFEEAGCMSSSPGHFAARSCNGFVHGVVWRDQAVLNQYELVFRDGLVPLTGTKVCNGSQAWAVTEEPSLPVFKRADSSNYGLHKGPLRAPHHATSKHLSPKPAPTTPHGVGPISEFLPLANVGNAAANDKIYSNGVATRGRVRNIIAHIVGDHMEVTAHCEGSDKQTYSLKAHVSQNGVVTYFHCTCPFHERAAGVPGSSGCCKHVVATLLEHNTKQESRQQAWQASKDQVAQRTLEASPEKAFEENDEVVVMDVEPKEGKLHGVVPSKPSKSLVQDDQVPSLKKRQTSFRALPSWLSPSQAAVASETPATTPASLSKVQTSIKLRKHKRRSVEVIARETRYQMNEQELLQTALEVLKQAGVDVPVGEEDLFTDDGSAQDQPKPRIKSPKKIACTVQENSNSDDSIGEDVKVMECLFGSRKRRRTASDDEVMALVQSSESEDDAELRRLLFGQAVEEKQPDVDAPESEDSDVGSASRNHHLAELLFGSGSAKSSSGTSHELVGVTPEDEVERRCELVSDRCFVPDSLAE